MPFSSFYLIQCPRLSSHWNSLPQGQTHALPSSWLQEQYKDSIIPRKINVHILIWKYTLQEVSALRTLERAQTAPWESQYFSRTASSSNESYFSSNTSIQHSKIVQAIPLLLCILLLHYGLNILSGISWNLRTIYNIVSMGKCIPNSKQLSYKTGSGKTTHA